MKKHSIALSLICFGLLTMEITIDKDLQKAIDLSLQEMEFEHDCAVAQQLSLMDISEQQESTPVARSSFFKDILGVNEQTFLREFNKDPFKFIRTSLNTDGKKILHLVNGKEQRAYQAGRFEKLSIKDIRKQAIHVPNRGHGIFNVIEAINPQKDSSFRTYVDIGALQADPKNFDAVFQVASNFNTLEPTGINHLPEQGVEGYIHDHTQGPFASISAAPGVIARMYYMFYNPDNAPQTWRQTSSHQINLLDCTNIPTVNGYVVYKHAPQHILTPQEYENIAVGFHSDIQVTFGFLTDLQTHEKINHYQIINQVFTAALDFGSTNRHLVNSPMVQQIAQQLLDASYEGTIKGAAINNKKKVFLTLIGGGVFANKISSIVAAIKKNEQFIKDRGLNVTLIIYNGNQFPEQEKKNLLDMVHATQGSYIEYSDQFPTGKML